jgi:hypothetical protein
MSVTTATQESDPPSAAPGLGVEAAIIAIPAAALIGIAFRSGVDLPDLTNLGAELAAAARAVLVATAVVAGGLLLLRLLLRSSSSSPATGHARVEVRGHLHGPPVDGRLTRRRLVATHEGGHAAVVPDLGGKVIRGSITRNADAGLVTAEFRHDDPVRIATFLYSGAEAAGTTEGAGFDYAKAKREINRLPREERTAADRLARSEAARLVRKHRAEVERIAGVLVVKGRI